MVRTPSSTFSVSTATSGKSSLYPPSVFSVDWEADNGDTMSTSTGDSPPPRRSSVSIPASSSAQGPYCPRKPSLREILANTSQPPWTLATFMAYLSSNHCLETLEFTMDAGRYKKHYSKMMSRAGSTGKPPSKDCEYVQALWERLVDAYIRPSGSREVNIPGQVRDAILFLPPGDVPPAPEALDPAVAKVYELMEDSVLVPFLNSVYPQTAHPAISSRPQYRSNESLSTSAPADEDLSSRSRRSRRSNRNSPPPQTAVEPYANSYSPPSTFHRQSAPSTLTNFNKARFSNKLSQTTSNPIAETPSSIDAVASGPGTDGSGPGMTDDSASAGSPSNESPTTPPSSPPIGDPQYTKRDSGMWKKLGRLSGMKAAKKKSHGGLREE